MSTLKRPAKKSKSKYDIRQYYADNMVEDDNKTEVKGTSKTRNIIQDQDENDEEFNEDYLKNLGELKNKGTLHKQNMDLVSDMLVSLIIKNKVTSKNAFDVPLPDVEKLSEFNSIEGDNCWKKLSQTLDAGAKIYGFRVDSVHNEAYRVLGGLNRADLNESNSEERLKKEDHHFETLDEETEIQVKKNHKDTGGDITLEKNLNNIDTNKYDLEFDIDPLFKKTSAKFDEVGAKGLLLNNLFVDSRLNLMFNSNDLEIEDSNFLNKAADEKKSKLTWQTFSAFKAPKSFKICPELLLFKQNYLKDCEEFWVDEQIQKFLFSTEPNSYRHEFQLKFESIDVNAHKILNSFGKMIIEDIDYIKKPFQNVEKEIEFDESFLFNENATNITQKDSVFKEEDLNFNIIQDKFSTLGLGTAIEKLKPDGKSVKISTNICFILLSEINKKSKKVKKEGLVDSKTKAFTSKKNKILIEFNLSIKEKWKDILGIVSNTKKKQGSKTPSKNLLDFEGIKQFYLLPLDMQIKPKRLSNLFQRSLDDNKEEYSVSEIKLKLNEDWDRFEENFEKESHDQEINFQNEIHQNLENIFTKKNKDEVHIDRREKAINIKVLKETIWEFLLDKISFDYCEESQKSKGNALNKPHQLKKGKKNSKNDSVTFAAVYGNLPSIISNENFGNISIHSCFVTILHLANEKNLKFVDDFPDDFKIFKECV